MMSVRPVLVAAVFLCRAAALGAQPAVTAQVQAAEKQIASGDLAGGIRALQKAVSATPASFDAHLALGRALDLDGRYTVARRHLEQAVKLASDDQRNTALTTLGISYAFESKADEAARYYQRAFDARMRADDREAAAALANALGRIYLESGNLQKAAQWYGTGLETAKQISHLPAGQRALWEMRWHNAEGRIAARRGDRAAAAGHAAAVKKLLDQGGNDGQRPFYPYLLGYIAFFSQDYREAIDQLSKGDQNDPFVLGLIAQAHRRLGDRVAAADYYRKVMASPAHNINAAFSRPLARAFLR